MKERRLLKGNEIKLQNNHKNKNGTNAVINAACWRICGDCVQGVIPLGGPEKLIGFRGDFGSMVNRSFGTGEHHAGQCRPYRPER
jgi:hypothetical protein